MWSINCCKVLPAFRIPKVILVKSNRLNGMVIAILVMSPGFMGIWLQVCPMLGLLVWPGWHLGQGQPRAGWELVLLCLPAA